MIGGGGSHSINMAFKALNLGALWEGSGKAEAPVRVEAETAERCVDTFSRWQIIRFELPARGSQPPARINWYNAAEPQLKRMGIWSKLERIAGRSLEWKSGWTPRSGTLLVGSKGVVHTNAHNSLCALLPEAKFPNTGGPPQSLPHVESHHMEWINACKGGLEPLSNFSHSGPAMELLLLGNIATLVGRPIAYDPLAGTIINDEKANGALRRQYREGWRLE
jgi:hypothetical protein